MKRNDYVQLSILAMSIVVGGNQVCRAAGSDPGDPQEHGWCGAGGPGAIEGAHNLLLWPDTIPYEFDPQVTVQQQQQFLDAMVGISAVCDLQFLPHTDEANWVYVKHSQTPGVSFSSIGMIGGMQNLGIWLSHWDSPDVMQHEMMHAAGLFHEQQRTDRDTWVQIIWENIDPAYAHAFEIASGSSAYGPYDLGSIMHYRRRSFTVNGGATIDVLPPYKRHWQILIGQGEGLSNGDVRTLCHLYGGTPPPQGVELLSPIGSVVGSDWTPSFAWSSEPADSYHLLVATNPDFIDPVIDVSVSDPTYSHGAALEANTIYYWTVTAINDVGDAEASPFPYAHFYTGDGVAEVLHVDDDAPAGGTAADWLESVPDLQTALDMAILDGTSVSEIRLAQGVYTPDRGTGNRAASFRLVNGVTIRGGYAGPGEPDPSLHDPVTYQTVLSGDLAGDDLPGFVNVNENTKHIVYAPDVDDTARVYDLTIRGGNAAGPGVDENGSAIKIVNSNAVFVGCIIESNKAASGAISVVETPAIPEFYNLLMIGNTAAKGGAVFTGLGATPLFANTTMVGNSADLNGGALRAHYLSHPVLRNCILWGNSAPNGPQISLTSGGGAHPSQLTISHSDVSGGMAGVFVAVNSMLHWEAGMIDSDPLFVEPGEANFRLAVGSPCIDAGSNDYVPVDLETDLDGGLRIANGTVDMGSYESSCPADLTGDGVVDVNDLLIVLAAWGTPDGDVTGDGTTDVNDLLTVIGAWGACP